MRFRQYREPARPAALRNLRAEFRAAVLAALLMAARLPAPSPARAPVEAGSVPAQETQAPLAAFESLNQDNQENNEDREEIDEASTTPPPRSTRAPGSSHDRSRSTSPSTVLRSHSKDAEPASLRAEGLDAQDAGALLTPQVDLLVDEDSDGERVPEVTAATELEEGEEDDGESEVVPEILGSKGKSKSNALTSSNKSSNAARGSAGSASEILGDDSAAAREPKTHTSSKGFGFLGHSPEPENEDESEEPSTSAPPQSGGPPLSKASLGSALRFHIDQMGDWLWGHTSPDGDTGFFPFGNTSSHSLETEDKSHTNWWMAQRDVLVAPNQSRRDLNASKRGRASTSLFDAEHTHVPREDPDKMEKDAIAVEAASVARLIERKGPFFQSNGDVRVVHATTPGDDFAWWGRVRILLEDPFDHLLSGHTAVLLFFFTLLYTVFVLIFAGFFIAVSITCEASKEQYGIMSFQTAFAFSLQTSTTVGYTLPFDNHMFFDGCSSWLIVIYLQCILSMILNGLVIGIVMLRVGRSDRRATQIVFTNKAAIACIRGRFVLTFQVFDLFGQQPLINVSVRTIAVFREVSDLNTPSLWQTRAMRLTRPDDELGGRIFLSVPCQVMHEIDAWSPLATSELSAAPVIADAAIPNMFPQPPQRAADGRIGSRTQALCPACGASFATDAALRRHIAYYQFDETERGRGPSFGHRGISGRDATRPVLLRRDPGHEVLTSDAAKLLNFRVTTTKKVRDGIRKRFLQRGVEIIAIVEGTDPRTSNSFQSRHSYTYRDIVWDKQHASCCGIGPKGEAQVNLSLFHSFIDCAVNEEHPVPGVSQS